jgi:curved DNA-binding protein CbpA
MNNQQLPDFSKIMKLAQQVASRIEPPAELKSGKVLTEDEMNRAIASLTKSVTEAVTPDMFDSVNVNVNVKDNTLSTKKKGKLPIAISKEHSKISFIDEPIKEENTESDENGSSSDVQNTKKTKKDKKKRLVEIDSDCSEELDNSSLRTNDMSFTLTVKLEDLYNGTRKKLAIRRQKIGDNGTYFEDKKKLAIKIEPGMLEDQTIRFNRLADEKIGYETGDVVVTLDVEEHPVFMRDGNNLIIEKEISLAESYNPVVYIEHLNGKILKITGDPLNIFSEEDGMLKKVPGYGMPVLGERNEFGDLFIRFKCVNNASITPELIEILNKYFPPLVVVPDLTDKKLIEKKFETVTESDLEFLESDSDEYDSDEFSESDSEESD